jgi:hypothetical protein
MEYLIPLVIVLILVGGFVTFMVLNATRRSSSAADGRGEEPPGIGQDETPLGDTSEHAGQQTESGRTVAGQDADEAGGTGEPVHSGYEGTSAAGRDPGRETAHVRRPGEGEGGEHLEFDDVEPEAGAREREARSAGAHAAGRSGAQEPEEGEEERSERARSDDRSDEGRDPDRPASERLADRGF